MQAYGNTKTLSTELQCASGEATFVSGQGWTCSGCGRLFKRSPNQHIHAARKRVRARAAAAHNVCSLCEGVGRVCSARGVWDLCPGVAS